MSISEDKIKNQRILVFADIFAKWVEIVPIKNKLATTVEEEFDRKIICKWKTPRILFTDNDKEFINGIMTKLIQNFGI